MIKFVLVLIGMFIGCVVATLIDIKDELNEYSEKLDDWNKELREMCGDNDE